MSWGIHIMLLGGKGGIAPFAFGNVITSFARNSSNSEYLTRVSLEVKADRVLNALTFF